MRVKAHRVSGILTTERESVSEPRRHAWTIQGGARCRSLRFGDGDDRETTRFERTPCGATQRRFGLQCQRQATGEIS